MIDDANAQASALTSFLARSGAPACLGNLAQLLVDHGVDANDLAARLNAACAADADVSGVASTLLVRLINDSVLDGVLDRNPDALSSRATVVSLHERQARGLVVGREEWSRARAEALTAADRATRLPSVVADMIAAAAWNPQRARTVLTDAFRHWLTAREMTRTGSAEWTPQMAARAQAILEQIADENGAAMERGEPVNFPALFAERDPELEKGFRENLARSGERATALACEASDMVIAAFATAHEDPYLWLEDVEGAAALEQVRAWNQRTDTVLRAHPDFPAYEARARAILDDTRRIAFPALFNGHVYNFWSDANHLRGIWRRSPEQAYFAGQPEWDVLLDIDALCRDEGANWVWSGAMLLRPDGDRCMVSLSDGGRDAVTWREYDLVARRFVTDGFVIAEAKTNLVWLDRDTLLVTSDFGAGTLTKAGYAREVRRWVRGTFLSDAPTLDAVAEDDMSITPLVERDSVGTWPMVLKGRSFWTSELVHLGADGTLIASPLPSHAVLQCTMSGFAIAKLQEDGEHGPAGSLVAYSIVDLLAGRPVPLEPVVAAPENGAIDGVSSGCSRLFVGQLENVAGQIVSLERHGFGDWRCERIATPPNSSIFLVATEKASDRLVYASVGMTHPLTLHLHVPGEPDRTIASASARFAPDDFIVTQRFAVSEDGTRIPYFLALPRNVRGPVPVLIYAYGGFRQSLVPGYVGPMAQFLLESGVGYVMANIRGGGEFGPAWHAAALREKRQRAFDDLHAVASDLKASHIASTVGIHGDSNGGLLVGAAFTQRPDLYDAVVMAVPLADMKRYHKLLAGASWMEEYGNPDVAEDWAFIRRYSPYHNLRADVSYPPVLFQTSTKDDRVHPAHARKMAARMAALGHGFDYYENIDGGHGGSADNSQAAFATALLSIWLKLKLLPSPA